MMNTSKSLKYFLLTYVIVALRKFNIFGWSLKDYGFAYVGIIIYISESIYTLGTSVAMFVYM